MLANSRDIIRRLQSEGWKLDRIRGSHHIFKNPANGAILPVPHPKPNLGTGLVHKIYKLAGWAKD